MSGGAVSSVGPKFARFLIERYRQSLRVASVVAMLVAGKIVRKSMIRPIRMGSFTSSSRIASDNDRSDVDVDHLLVTSPTSVVAPQQQLQHQKQQQSRPKFCSSAQHEQLSCLCRKELARLPPLLRRSFRKIGQKEQPSGGERIRVLQWNILAQALGEHNDNFSMCPPEALNWKTRRFRILEELISYSPDVICLQEVDHYTFLKKTLGSLGYAGVFFPKPDSPCIYIQGNNGPDGCAIFYQEDKYELVKTATRVMEVWHVQSNQVAILTVLRSKATGRNVCVACTHLKARKGALMSALRNEQGKDLLDFLAVNTGPSDDMTPLIVCGDFNAEPCEPVYSTVTGDPRLRLSSAYACAGRGASDGTKGENGEPPYTTWKVREREGELCHTLDYIFFSANNSHVDSVLRFPSGEEIGNGRVPSFSYPSDHFSLVCDFILNEGNVTTSADSSSNKL